MTALSNASVPVIGFCGPSGSGKTTLLRYVVGLLVEQGIRVGAIKQARADFDVDHPGKDSYELRKAGVERLLLGSERQSALIIEHSDEAEPELNALLALLEQQSLDLILVEGFAAAPVPKIELYRQGMRRARYLDDPWVIAVVTDVEDLDAALPVFDIDDPWSLADFVQSYIHHPLLARSQP